jgi:hypothetical protein
MRMEKVMADPPSFDLGISVPLYQCKRRCGSEDRRDILTTLRAQ